MAIYSRDNIVLSVSMTHTRKNTVNCTVPTALMHVRYMAMIISFLVTAKFSKKLVFLCKLPPSELSSPLGRFFAYYELAHFDKQAPTTTRVCLTNHYTRMPYQLQHAYA